MLKWQKIGHIYNPFDEQYRPTWRYHYAMNPSVVVFDDYVRVYFTCREKRDENSQTISRTAYCDLDRKCLSNIIRVSEKPVIDVGGYGCFDEFGIYPFYALKHEDGIYGYYAGWTRCVSTPFNVSIGLSISSDGGSTFTRMGKGPILSYSLDEPFVIGSMSVFIINNKWYMFYAAGREWTKEQSGPEVYYKLRVATSDNGIEWNKMGVDIIPDKIDAREAQGRVSIIRKNDKYHMLFCYRNHIDFRSNPQNSYKIGYAVSSDLINWERNDALVGIDASSDQDAFDKSMVCYPHMFELDDKVYLLYNGDEFGKYGFGLAQLVEIK